MPGGHFNEQSARRIANEVRKSERTPLSDGREPPSDPRPRGVPVAPFQLSGSFSATASTLGSTEKAAPARFVHQTGGTYSPTTAMPAQRLYDPANIASGSSGERLWGAWRGRWEVVGGGSDSVSGLSVNMPYGSTTGGGSNTITSTGRITLKRGSFRWAHFDISSPLTGASSAIHLTPISRTSTWGCPTAQVNQGGLYRIAMNLTAETTTNLLGTTLGPYDYARTLTAYSTTLGFPHDHRHGYRYYLAGNVPVTFRMVLRSSTSTTKGDWSQESHRSMHCLCNPKESAQNTHRWQTGREFLQELSSGSQIGFLIAHMQESILTNSTDWVKAVRPQTSVSFTYLGPLSSTS